MLRRHRKLEDFSSEVESHIELESERLRAEGLGPEEARAAARRAFGNRLEAEEHFYQSHRWLWWDQLLQDVRSAVRALGRERSVTALCVLILAVGIGASTLLYAVWRAALVFPYDFENSGRWVAVLAGFNRQQTRSWFLSIPEYNDLRGARDIFENVSLLQHTMVNLTDNGHPESLDATAVSADTIRNTGVPPLLGRTFLPGEDAPGGPNVVVISDVLWQRRYQRDPNVLGRQLRMNGENYSVVGVMPPYFLMWGTELWIPLRVDDHDSNRSHRAYWVTAMLKKGVDQKQANTRLAVIAHEWEQQNGGVPEYANLRLWTEDVIRYVTSSLRQAVLVLLSAIAILLVITCLNVTNILLARVTTRRREIAIRLAVGGSRLRITRQFLTESLLLAVFAGLLGLLIAWQGLPVIRRYIVDYVSTESRDFALDGSTFVFVAGLIVVVSLVYGFAPAIQASKTSLLEALKEGGRAGGSRGGRQWRNVLVMMQISLALVVLACATLMMQSYRRLSRSDLGFDPRQVVAANLSLPQLSYPTPSRTASFLRALEQSVAAGPGIAVAGLVSSLPIADRLDRQDFLVAGRPATSAESRGGAACRFATPGYFRAMGIPLESGRLFGDEDREGGQAVAIVNETLAKRFWPKESALGKQIALGRQYSERIASATASERSSAAWITVVGVIHDVRQSREWDAELLPEIYLPLWQTSTPIRDVRLVARSGRAASDALVSIRESVARLDGSLPLGDTQTLEQVVADAYGTELLAFLLLAIFAAVALILAVAGVYAVLSYNVTERSHEIAIRMALGALPGEVLGFILRFGARLAVLGVAAGILGGLAAARLMTRLLYQLKASDPVVFAWSAAVLLGAALLACYFPARRATGVDPLVALRHE